MVTVACFSDFVAFLLCSGVSEYLYTCIYITRLLSRSPEWANITDKEREKLGLTFDDDGEFW